VEAFGWGLRDLGYVDGQNILIEYRYPEGDLAGLDNLASDLARLPVDVIVTAGPAVRTASQVAPGTPIVFAALSDPVGDGLIASFARPGGHLTGITNFAREIDSKRLELLKESVPGLSRVVHLWDPRTTPGYLETAAQVLGLQLGVQELWGADELDRTFETMMAEAAQALIVSPSPRALSLQLRLRDLAAQYRIPTMHYAAEFVEAGGLMAYTHNSVQNWRRAAYYVDRILKGTPAADLPVEQPMRFDFVINLQTAHALSLTIPPHVLLQATEVIQ
jgi:putative ABC transport system substrate-binding protein